MEKSVGKLIGPLQFYYLFILLFFLTFLRTKIQNVKNYFRLAAEISVQYIEIVSDRIYTQIENVTVSNVVDTFIS